MLRLEDLNVSVEINDVWYPVLEDISFSVEKDETLGLVGESGCGKSMTAMSIMGLLRDNIKIVSGKIIFDGTDLAAYGEKEYQNLRGSEMSMIFQDSMSSLNPLMKVGRQIAESYQIHYSLKNPELKEKVIEALKNVGFVNPEETYYKYPHQLSGGQRQRVMIAIAISAGPKLLIADEPTTALDVTTQNKILTLIKNIQAERHMSIIIISHDITVISQTCSHICVMYSGWAVEVGKAQDIITNPMHPYTKALIGAIPKEEVKDKPLSVIKGTVPSLMKRPETGCVFYDRCDFRMEECKGDIPKYTLENGRTVRCVLYGKANG